MSVYPEVNDAASLNVAISDALSKGAASVYVPFFGSNSCPFDDLITAGVAAGYTLWVEISLIDPSEGGAQ